MEARQAQAADWEALRQLRLRALADAPDAFASTLEEEAAYPVPGLRRAKYWPPVGRIDGGYGDRNLVCSCPPPEAFES